MANALSTVVGVFTIVTALLQGDPMGAEPLLPQDNVIQCMHREEQYSMGTYSHREQKLNVALAAEFTRYIRMTTPAQLRALIDARVKGMTTPHSNWTIYNNQLYGLLWRALPDDIRRRVEADMTEADGKRVGDGVWLWGVLKELIDPNHEITVIQLILSILTFKQSNMPFTEYYVKYKQMLSKYADMCTAFPELTMPHGILVIIFVRGLSSTYSNIVSTVIGMGKNLSSMSLEDVKARCESQDRMFGRTSRDRRPRRFGSALLSSDDGDTQDSADESGADNTRTPSVNSTSTGKTGSKKMVENGPVWEKRTDQRALYVTATLHALAAGLARGIKQALCWNCGDPTHKSYRCPHPCGSCMSPNHKRKFDSRTKTFSCQNRDADGNNTRRNKHKQKSG